MNWSAVNSLVTVLTALGALLFAGLSLNNTRNQLVTTQGEIDIARSQNRVAEQGQFTDRYSRAVEQIGQQGADHLQIRLGGIYALERLAHDSPPDQPTILAVLSAFVRTTAPAKVGTSSGEENCPEQLSPDIQAALTVIGRRDTNDDKGTRIDLHDVCLRNAQLTDANLSNADLADTILGRANLEGADLSKAYLLHANLSGASLDGANLSNANLKYANLGFADLNSANLSHANLNGANLESADLNHANLNHANLNHANLNHANLIDANLIDAEHNNATSVDGARKDDATKGAWW